MKDIHSCCPHEKGNNTNHAKRSIGLARDNGNVHIFVLKLQRHQGSIHFFSCGRSQLPNFQYENINTRKGMSYSLFYMVFDKLGAVN